MGWRENMRVVLNNELLRPYIQKGQKVQKAEKNSKKDTFACIAGIAHRVQKVKTPEIIIKKMSTCLHGKPCYFLSFADDRQICGRNNKTIFDMAVCPDGRWFKTDTKNSGNQRSCYSCGGQTFWRMKSYQDRLWICEVCHPPVLSKDEIEWL